MTRVPFRYEAEDPKWKHAWGRDEPGFASVPSRKGPGSITVGKCPSRFYSWRQVPELNTALEEGIKWSDGRWSRPYPARIYIVHEGFLYRAKPTNPGVSYHAFPANPDDEDLPRELFSQIRERAKELGCADEIERWLR